jgi:ABC-type sugar transport system substrate-binding protein
VLLSTVRQFCSRRGPVRAALPADELVIPVPNDQGRYKTMGSRQASERQRKAVKRAGQAIVFVITFGSSVISFVAFGISVIAITVILLGLLLLLSLLANSLYFIDARNRRKGPKQIAFLTPSSGGDAFYATMLEGLVRSTSLALGQNYVLIPSMPAESFEEISIWTLFSNLEDRQLEIDGIIFIPDQPDRHFDELVGFHEKRGDIPLILIDVYFDLNACDERTRARLPSFVGGDEEAGGRLAAELILEGIGTPDATPPVVLIVNGGFAPWEQQRAKAFREQVVKAWPIAKIIETPPINYSRSTAYELSMQLIRKLADAKKRICVHAIFACADDMAVGVRAAIVKLTREGYKFSPTPQIVGYDGIPEMREYINGGDCYIAGTVDVRIEEQAKAAMLLMHKLLRSGQRHSEVHLIAPRSIRRN